MTTQTMKTYMMDQMQEIESYIQEHYGEGLSSTEYNYQVQEWVKENAEGYRQEWEHSHPV